MVEQGTETNGGGKTGPEKDVDEVGRSDCVVLGGCVGNHQATYVGRHWDQEQKHLLVFVQKLVLLGRTFFGLLVPVHEP